MLVGLHQFLIQLPNLLLKVCDNLGARVIVDGGLISDESSLGGVGQGGQVFLQETIIGVNAGDHQAVGIPSDRLF